MKLFLILIIVIFTLLLIASILLGRYVISTIFNPEKQTFEDLRKQDSDFLECFDAYENIWDRHEFSFERDGANIKGEYIINPASQGERKKVIIICHGHIACRAADFKYAMTFYELGYNLVIFDERYFGESVADHCTLGDKERLDIAYIISYTREVFGQDAFIGLHGESMGGASVLMVLEYQKVDFVVADCPFANTKELLLFLSHKVAKFLARPIVFFATIYGKKRGYDLTNVNPIEAVEKTDVPICFIHGEADEFIPYEHSERMYAVSKNSLNEIHIVPGANHAKSNATDKTGYAKIIRDFVTKIEKASGVY